MSAIFDPHHFFDKIFCISIKERVDRQKTAREAFATLGISDRVEFLLVEKHPTNPEEGIFCSHLLCLSRGLQEGAEHILIFEDDVSIAHFQEQRMTAAINGLQEVRWDCFFLGAIFGNRQTSASPHLDRIDYRCLTHGYAVNRPFAEKISQEQFQGVAYDGFLKQRCRRSYAPVPMIAFQNSSLSDNKTVYIDKVRRFFGGLQFLQKVNEGLQRHKISIVIGHGVVILLFLYLVVGR